MLRLTSHKNCTLSFLGWMYVFQIKVSLVISFYQVLYLPGVEEAVCDKQIPSGLTWYTCERGRWCLL